MRNWRKETSEDLTKMETELHSKSPEKAISGPRFLAAKSQKRTLKCEKGHPRVRRVDWYKDAKEGQQKKNKAQKTYFEFKSMPILNLAR